jgi:hypothetical protein
MTVIENATADLREARESLRKAEERRNDYLDNPANQPFNSNHTTYVELKAEVTRCTAILSGAQQTLQQALAAQNRSIGETPETVEEFNNVPELEASEPNVLFTTCFSRPPQLFEFNTAPMTNTLQIPLKPIILLILFLMATLNVILFWYTLFVVELIFLAVSCFGIIAVIKRGTTFISYFCWTRLFVDIIELIVDFLGFVSMSINGYKMVMIFSVFLGIIIKCFLKVFFLYCVVKYWESIREGYVSRDETDSLVDNQ